MQFYIEEASNAPDIRMARYIEDEVFRREKRLQLPPLVLPHGGPALSVLAREAVTGEPAGVLTVLETTGDAVLHERYGVRNPSQGRSARYTRLAVLPAFRGYGLSIRLILEAHRRFVEPNGIDHTWLLFDASRASSSLIASVLGFRCGARTFRSEYGLCRLLSRNEHSAGAQQGVQLGWTYVEALATVHRASAFNLPTAA